MEIQLKEYDPVPIPEVTEGEPFWLLALGNLTRHNSKVFQLDGESATYGDSAVGSGQVVDLYHPTIEERSSICKLRSGL